MEKEIEEYRKQRHEEESLELELNGNYDLETIRKLWRNKIRKCESDS
jgi:hypothetical protein